MRRNRVLRYLLCVVCSFLCVLVSAQQTLVINRDVDVTLTEGTSMAAAVSPDRRWIAVDLLGALWVLPMRGGEAKRITPDVLEARQPSWSPDSESLAWRPGRLAASRTSGVIRFASAGRAPCRPESAPGRSTAIQRRSGDTAAGRRGAFSERDVRRRG